MRKFIAFLCLIMLITTLSGCGNTMRGVGKDMENMGRWVQDPV